MLLKIQQVNISIVGLICPIYSKFNISIDALCIITSDIIYIKKLLVPLYISFKWDINSPAL